MLLKPKIYKFILIFLIIVIIVSIILYKISFYTPPLLDHGKRNMAEKTIDFLWFGWYLTKGSIIENYFGDRGTANEDYAKAGWHRKKYLVKMFRADEEIISLVLEVYKDLDEKSMIEKLYFFLMKDKNDRLRFFHDAGERLIESENWDLAERIFSKVVESNPDFADAYYRLGLIAEKTKDWKKAQDYYEKALNIQHNHSDSLNALKRIINKTK